MSIDTSILLCLDFQPNSACEHRGTLSFGVALRPSAKALMAIGMPGMGNASDSAYQLDSDNGFGFAEPQQGITRTLLTAQRPNNLGMKWFNGNNNINNINKGEHYSRPDGLPHSPPPKRRLRSEETGGITAS